MIDWGATPASTSSATVTAISDHSDASPNVAHTQAYAARDRTNPRGLAYTLAEGFVGDGVVGDLPEGPHAGAECRVERNTRDHRLECK